MPTSPHHTSVSMWAIYARSSKNYMWLLGPSSHSTRSDIIAYILTGLSSPNGLITTDRRRIQPWAWPSSFTGGICYNIHSIIVLPDFQPIRFIQHDWSDLRLDFRFRKNFIDFEIRFIDKNPKTLGMGLLSLKSGETDTSKLLLVEIDGETSLHLNTSSTSSPISPSLQNPG